MNQSSFISNQIKQHRNVVVPNAVNRDAAFFHPLVQPKLTINQPGDIYEQEADAMADKIMRMPAGNSGTSPFFRQAITPIQRMCSDCEEEEKTMQRKEAGTELLDESTPASYLKTIPGGTSLSKAERNFFEPRIGHDLANVRLHTDHAANRSARSINALAYTYQNNIVFASGQYDPGSDGGKRLMAHELTHTLQQTGDRGLPSNAVQRKLVIDPADVVPMAPGMSGPPLPLTFAVQGLLDDLCADGQFLVNHTSGNVTLTDPEFCDEWYIPMLPEIKRVNNTATPVGCACLCNVVNDAQTTTVSFRAGGPGASPGSVAGAGAGQGGVRTDSTVSIDPRFQGQYRINGQWVDVPFYLLFSHELCGHALPKMRGTHAARGAGPAGGTPPQERHAVDIERDIAAEHRQPRRPEDYSGDARERP